MNWRILFINCCFLFVLILIRPKETLAANVCNPTSSGSTVVTTNPYSNQTFVNIFQIPSVGAASTITFQLTGNTQNSFVCGQSGTPSPTSPCFAITACWADGLGAGHCNSNSTFYLSQMSIANGAISGQQSIDGNLKFWLEKNNGQGNQRACGTNSTPYDEWLLTIDPQSLIRTCGDTQAFQVTDSAGKIPGISQPYQVNYDLSKTANFISGPNMLLGGALFKYSAGILDSNQKLVNGTKVDLQITAKNQLAYNGSQAGTFLGTGPPSAGNYSIGIFLVDPTGAPYTPINLLCPTSFCFGDQPGSCSGSLSTPNPNQAATFALCNQTADASTKGKDYQNCLQCFGSVPAGTNKNIDKDLPKSLWTAFGCIRVDKQGLVEDILKIGLSLSGGVVILSILSGAFMLSVSSGDPKRIQDAQELISSAVIGLLFVIFSVLILQFIGVKLLHIPGFGG